MPVASGKITAIAHESGSGDLPGGGPETAVSQTKLLYAGANRLTSMRLAVLDLPEGNAMRAPGEAPGLMALEIAMDEMAEKLGMDPIAFRIGERYAGRSREARAPLFATSVDQVHCSSGLRIVRLGQTQRRNPRRSAMGNGSSVSACRGGFPQQHER